MITTNLVADISEAATRLEGIVRRTPLEFSPWLSARYGAQIFLKREDLQLGGSYKIRGAYNVMASLGPAERATGVVTASTGNHAMAVAQAARRLNLAATVYVPEATSAAIQRRIRAAGASLSLAGANLAEALAAALHQANQSGASLAEALAAATEHAHNTGASLVHPYDDDRIVAGQGTMAVEIAAQLSAQHLAPEVLVAPIGGGGLISGLGTYLKSRQPNLQLIGVRPAQATGLLAALGAAGRHPLAASVTDQTVHVPESDVRRTLAELNQLGIQASPAGALAAAALTQLSSELAGRTVVVIISGAAIA